MAEKTEKKSGNQIVKLALVLLAVAAIMAFVLGIVNEITKDRIAEIAAEKTATAYANVLEAPTYDEATDFTNDENQTITKLSVAKNDAGETTGYVAETTFSGAQGMITLACGVDNDFKCTGISIISHSETSGLGANAASSADVGVNWRAQFVGVGEDVKLKKAGGTIDALAGATITSRTVTATVADSIAAVKEVA